jgi:nitronate monooxygenase
VEIANTNQAPPLSTASSFLGRLRLPVIAAPMFLVSGPDMVVAAHQAGIVGSFPTPNCRSTEELERWLTDISRRIAIVPPSPWSPRWAVNLVVHKANPRLQDDMSVVVKHRVPLVIASVGAPDPVIDAVHAYGGRVICDVASLRHAKRAVNSGVDGLVLLTSGAGGQEGSANPFAFVRAVRRFYDGFIALAGCIADGASLLAARVLGADVAYIGTGFIVATESMAQSRYRQMLVESTMDDVFRTNAVTGLYANLLRPSIVAAGIDPDSLKTHAPGDISKHLDPELQDKRWKDIWAAGQGVTLVDQIAPVSDIVLKLENEYRAAIAGLTRLASATRFSAAQPAA